MQRARWCCLGGLLLSLLGSAVYGAEKGGSPPAAKLFHVRIRAVDARGRPIAGALIEAWHTGGEPGDFKVRRLVVNGANEIRSKADGWAVVSFSLVVKPATNRSLCTYFCFTAQATGHLVTRSGPIAAESSDRFEIVLTLRRLVSVEGRVVNRQGRPVADATVFHTGNATERTEVKTDSQGRFRLDGLPEGRPPIFVTHPAYHFYGQLADTSAKQQELRPLELDRSPPPLRTLPPLNSHEQELRLARRVIRRILESAEEGKKDRWNWQLYANLDPWYVLEYVERHLSKEVKNPFACRAMPLLYPARRRRAGSAGINRLRRGKQSMGVDRDGPPDTQIAPGAEAGSARSGHAARARITDPLGRVLYLSRAAQQLFELGKVDEAKWIVEAVTPTAVQLPPTDNQASPKRAKRSACSICGRECVWWRVLVTNGIVIPREACFESRPGSLKSSRRKRSESSRGLSRSSPSWRRSIGAISGNAISPMKN